MATTPTSVSTSRLLTFSSQLDLDVEMLPSSPLLHDLWLPNELWLAIFHYLRDSSDLAHLARTCWKFNNLATPLLLRTLHWRSTTGALRNVKWLEQKEKEVEREVIKSLRREREQKWEAEQAVIGKGKGKANPVWKGDPDNDEEWARSVDEERREMKRRSIYGVTKELNVSIAGVAVGSHHLYVPMVNGEPPPDSLVSGSPPTARFSGPGSSTAWTSIIGMLLFFLI